MDICNKCSSKRKYLNYGIKRLCNDCQKELDKNDYKVVKRIVQQAGYDLDFAIKFAKENYKKC